MLEGQGAKPEAGDAVIFLCQLIPENTANEAVAEIVQQLQSRGTMHVASLGKGERIPRGWELILQGVHLLCTCT